MARDGDRMNSPQSEHPSADQLQAFVLGTLSLDKVAAVEEHVSECAACQQVLEQFPVTEHPFVRQWARA